MKAPEDKDSVVVAQYTQDLTSDKQDKTTHAGKIYFDTSGKIVGFSVADPATTTPEEVSS